MYFKFYRLIDFNKWYLWHDKLSQRGMAWVTWPTRFSKSLSLYSETMRDRASFYGMIIGNHRRSVKSCYSRWPSVTFEGYFDHFPNNSLLWSVAQCLCNSWASCFFAEKESIIAMLDSTQNSWSRTRRQVRETERKKQRHNSHTDTRTCYIW